MVWSECLGENTEKYITIKVTIKKKNKDGEFTTFKPRIIDSFRFMNRSLSELVDNLSEINMQEFKKCKEIKDESINCK